MVLIIQSKARSSFLSALLNWHKNSNFFKLAVLRRDSKKQNYGDIIFINLPMPTIPTVFFSPDPAPQCIKGLYIVIPAQRIGAVFSKSMPSGIFKTKSS